MLAVGGGPHSKICLDYARTLEIDTEAEKHISEVYSEPCQWSIMERFCGNTSSHLGLINISVSIKSFSIFSSKNFSFSYDECYALKQG